MDIFNYVIITRNVKRAFKDLNKDIKHYLKFKDSQNLSRTHLFYLIRKFRNKKLEILNKANLMFPEFNWLEFYNK